MDTQMNEQIETAIPSGYTLDYISGTKLKEIKKRTGSAASDSSPDS